ncbi:AAA domain protein [Collimonas arenae]|uniref:AAA domain protein n=2 Tax=Collimonas arenae TaxID=279058 RepID=A0A127QFP8_9BURK|nr:MinD/ParA family protein [Collimonas arenae]AMO98752.1 AAA domain protein [Collimonas arenae]AMP08645.1 AAA domain protein [Collimonas arenae]
MNARNKALNELTALSRFVFCSRNSTQAEWLGAALGKWGTLLQEKAEVAELLPRIVELNPLLVLLDFSGVEHAHDSASVITADFLGTTAHAIELAQALAKKAPGLPLVAVGSMTFPEGAIAALRAGVSDFIDVSASEEEARDVVQRVLAKAAARAPAQVKRGQLVTLLGVRPGIGTSTLAVHLADMIQQRGATAAGSKRLPTDSRVALLDLGLPAGDGKLYLSAAGNFDFAEAVRNLRRFDETLVHTALPRSPGGVTVISLPHSLSEMRTVSHHDALALLDRLRLYFDVLIADLGGFSNHEFIANLAGAADQVWLVTDQSVGALVSLAGTLQELNGRHPDDGKRRLVVNRYDDRFGMAAAQIAERFKLPLLATLPERTLKLTSSANRGKLLHEVAPHDHYVRAIDGLIDGLLEHDEVVPHKTKMGHWLPKIMLRK